MLSAAPADEDKLSEQSISLEAPTALHFVLIIVCMQMMPLIWACTDGVRVLGAELDVPISSRYAAARRWADALVPGAGAITFLAGRSADGGMPVYVAPISYSPPADRVARSASARRRLVAAGVRFAWLSVAALAGTVVHHAAAQAVFAADSLRSEFGQLPQMALPSAGGAFRLGVTGVRSLVDVPEGLPSAFTALEAAASRMFYDTRLLTEALLADGSDMAADMHDWAAQSAAPPLAEVPSELLESLPAFTDERFDQVAFPAVPPPRQKAWVPRMPRQRPAVSGRCFRRAADLMPARVWRRVERWLHRTLVDLVCIRDHGPQCERSRPGVLVIGQLELHEEARGRVWDFRLSPAECAVPLDYHAPLEHTLSIDYLQERLADYPNQELLGFIVEGVRPWADVELQTVLVPHLMSLANGFPSVVKELKRMSAPELRWYSMHADFPFWPMYSLGEGCVPRKLENRWRRCEEGGGPRKPSFDASGLRALSINEAAMVHHFPLHYAQDDRPEWLHYLDARGLPATPEMDAAVVANRGTKWLRQRMPTLSDAARSLLVLKRAAHLMGEPVYLFGDDVKDYFNHLVHASEVLPLMNTIFLDADDLADEPQYTTDAGSLVFVHEKRMGFGLHPWSIVAQELSEAINDMLRADIDAVEDPLLEADPRPAVQRWLSERRRLEARVGGHQRRLYFVLMFCDDNIIGVVGVERAMRVLKAWRRLTSQMGLIMAIPEKRSIGVWCLWVGALIFASLAIIVIPKHKLVRASAAVRTLLQHGLEFSEYRSLMGLLEHLRCVARIPKRYTHGLYAPHGAGGESQDGPNALVKCRIFMAVQFQKWLDLLTHCGGCAVTAVLRRTDLRVKKVATFLSASDAATDSQPPGMGGFMHGFYWQMSLSADDVKWLHITVLELLACVFNAIISARVKPPAARLMLMVDATSAFYTLADETERSEVLVFAHHAALSSSEFCQAARQCDVVHGSGSVNLAGDAASRSEWGVLRELASSLRIRLQRLQVPSECHEIFAKVLQYAQQRGKQVRHGARPPSPPEPQAVRDLLQHVQHGITSKDPVVGTSSSSFLTQEVVEHMPSKLVAALQQQRQRTSTNPDLSRPAAKAGRGVAAAIRKQQQSASSTATAVVQRPPTVCATAPSQRGLRGRTGRMQTASVAGVVLAAPAFTRSATPNARRVAREADTRRSARERASMMVSSHASAQDVERVAAGLHHAAALAQLGAAATTLNKDDLAWEKWREFSGVYGFDPVVSRHMAVQCPDLLSSRLGLFYLWVYPRVAGRGHADAHPRSVLNNYPGAVARVLKRDHKLPVPRAATYEAEAKGLLRSYKRIYGTLALAPKRRQPMTRSMWARVEALLPNQPLTGRSAWLTSSAHLDRQGLRTGRILSATAHRLGEIVEYTSDEITYLTMEHVTYCIAGVILVDPTRAQLLSMRPGDLVYLAPCSSKPDQFGEEHCTFPSVLEYDGEPTSAAGAIREIELERPCRGHARHTAPLVADERGQPYSYYILNRWLHDLMVALFGHGVAETLSWHSFRIELACLLRAAGCPDSMIQLLCRWKCPASVQTYAQVGSQENVRWIHRAHAVRFDAVRTNNMVALDNSDAYAELSHSRAAQRRAPPSPLYPAVKQRVEVKWGDEWYAGLCTSRKQGANSAGQDATLHRVLYDAVGAWRVTHYWHDFTEVQWRQEQQLEQ